MNKNIIFILCLIGVFFVSNAQKKNKYGLKVVSDTIEYKTSIQKDSSNTLINIVKAIPDIKLKYATTDNFLKEAVYKYPIAYSRKPVVEALLKVQNELEKHGLGLKIYDAYRPYSITEYLYKKNHNSKFVSNPKHGSRHNRGCAVDVTIIDLKTGEEINMPSKFDDFTEKAHINYMKLPKEVINNRNLLINTMAMYGFKVYAAEWWHFDYISWKNYDVMDISFSFLID